MIVDARGTVCPYPIVALGRAARHTPHGTELTLLADDPVALSDVPAWCRMRGATLAAVVERAGHWEFRIVTARSAAP